jgi:hypothetical protein
MGMPGWDFRARLQICFFWRGHSVAYRRWIVAATFILVASFAMAVPLTTTTTLTTTASPVSPGTVVTLTATVLDSNSASVSQGTVNFYDASATPKLIGSAQLTTSAQAVIKLKFGVGSHSLTAAFQTTTADTTSTSPAQVLVVSTASFATTSTISSSGSNGVYTLTGTVTAFGKPTPTGNIQFQDTSNSNIAIATPVSSVAFGLTSTSITHLAAALPSR